MPIVLPEVTATASTNGSASGTNSQQDSQRVLAEKVAARVLEMLRRELLIERERRGRGGR